jgi:hypothetical protein
MSGKSNGLTDTLISVMATKPSKSSAHALTVISAVVELLLVVVLVLIVKRWSLERGQSLVVQSSFALDARELRHFVRHVLRGPIILPVVLSVVYRLFKHSVVRLA